MLSTTPQDLSVTTNDLEKPIPQPANVPKQGNTTTIIDHRTDLSPLYRVLRLCIRPLRPRLVGIIPLNETGSPQLRDHPTSHYGVTISERLTQVADSEDCKLTQADAATNTQKVWLYDFVPKVVPPTNGVKGGDGNDDGSNWWTHTIYYFAGGGFQAPASGEHWKLTARLAKDLAPRGIRVVMISYPLAPKSPAKDSIPLLRAWLAKTLQDTRGSKQTVTLMGDSAGGNVVLSLAFWWATRLARMTGTMAAEEGETQPSDQHTSGTTDHSSDEDITTWKHLTHVLTISPPGDFRDINPDIAKADAVDPVLDASVTKGAADAWCAGWPCPEDIETAKADPALSPNLQPASSWSHLKQSNLTVNGIIGTADRLGPDAQVFMGRCKEEGIQGRWLVWEGQMHCFPLTRCYGLREGREGFGWLVERMEEVVKG